MKIVHRSLALGKDSRAFEAFYQGRYNQAYEILQELVKNSPHNIVFLKGLAFCALMEENYQEALEYLEEAKNIVARDSEVRNFIALVYLKTGKIETAIETLLDALEIIPNDSLLKKSLESIRTLKNPEHAKLISILPLVRLTLPIPLFSKKIISIAGIILLIFAIGTIFPFLARLHENRFSSAPLMAEISIRNLDSIIDARENFRVTLTENQIKEKFNNLKTYISDDQPNKARIVVNELLNSNADFQVKERVSILEGFIPEPSDSNIDFVPTYSEISASPLLYENIALRWNGTIVNVNNGSKQTTFNLLINLLGNNQVEGIGAVEIDNPERGIRYKNGQKVIVTGKFDGITKDNRVIIKAFRVSPL